MFLSLYVYIHACLVLLLLCVLLCIMIVVSNTISICVIIIGCIVIIVIIMIVIIISSSSMMISIIACPLPKRRLAAPRGRLRGQPGAETHPAHVNSYNMIILLLRSVVFIWITSIVPRPPSWTTGRRDSPCTWRGARPSLPYIYIYIYIYTIYIYIYIHLDKAVYTHICMYIYIYIYICSFIITLTCGCAAVAALAPEASETKFTIRCNIRLYY